MRLLIAILWTFASCGDDGGGGDDRRVDAGPDADADTDADEVCLGDTVSPTAAGPCGCQADCDAPELCVTEETYGIPGGLCLRVCEQDGDCASGQICDPDLGCADGCVTTDECRLGYVCTSLGSAAGDFRCVGQCQDDADCPATGTCDLYSVTCGNAGEHPGNGALGDPCNSDADCMGAFCGQGDGFPGGYCTAFCTVSRQGCPEDGICVPQLGDADDMGTCFRSCTLDSECREAEGYICGSDPRFESGLCASPA